MKTIWKYELKSEFENALEIPDGAGVLSVKARNDTPILYFLVNPENKKVSRIFEIYETGQPIEAGNRRFVGSVLTDGDDYVFHIFEKL